MLVIIQVKMFIFLFLWGQFWEYQYIGLDWLVIMYEKKFNGIFVDEMGFGKIIQIIFLFVYLVCEKGNWGFYLIIVFISVMLNWEMELKWWCFSFKIFIYYGVQKERKFKWQGWIKFNVFYVCIIFYKLVLQDYQVFCCKNWCYFILDEVQNIKNFKLQCWQLFFNFNSQRCLFLIGIFLQNSFMELWFLMYFLMFYVFQFYCEFKEWFFNFLIGMIEGS